MKVYTCIFFVLKNKNKLGLSKNLELCLKKEILVSEQDFVGEGLRDLLWQASSFYVPKFFIAIGWPYMTLR